MVDAAKFVRLLLDSGIRYFAGVPDSLLSDLIKHIAALGAVAPEVCAANEGNAVALGAGFHLATGGLACVYLQNSGLGNALNPLLSMCDARVHGIPLLLLIGWRGEPGHQDEPQHLVQGEVTLPLLDAVRMPYRILQSSNEGAADDVRAMVKTARSCGGPAALVVPSTCFAATPVIASGAVAEAMKQDEALSLVDQWCQSIGAAAFVTTGHISRGIVARHSADSPPPRYFLNLGAMGHVSQLALAFAMHRPEIPVLCIDGDGSALMHLGGLATIGSRRPRNLLHVIFNNGAHGSVGGFPTCADLDFRSAGRALGYRSSVRAESGRELAAQLARFGNGDGPMLIDLRVEKFSAGSLPRPRFTAAENRRAFARTFDPASRLAHRPVSAGS